MLYPYLSLICVALRDQWTLSYFVNTSLRFFYGHFVGECHVLITVMRDEGCVKTSKRR